MQRNAIDPAPSRNRGFARHRLPAAGRLLQLCLLPVWFSGCAVHYGDATRGIQRVWGIGRTTWKAQTLTNDFAAVSSGFRLPGLVLGIGPDFVGINLGYHVRERLQIMPQAELADRGAGLNGYVLAPDEGSRWGIGCFRTRTPKGTGIAVVQGRAAAGLTLAVEGGLPSAAAGWESRQITSVSGEDVFLELQSPSRAWPYFDFPETAISAQTPNPRPQTTFQP